MMESYLRYKINEMVSDLQKSILSGYPKNMEEYKCKLEQIDMLNLVIELIDKAENGNMEDLED